MILQAREDALQGIVKDIESKLATFSSNKKKYTSLLTDLILQVYPPINYLFAICPAPLPAACIAQYPAK